MGLHIVTDIKHKEGRWRFSLTMGRKQWTKKQRLPWTQKNNNSCTIQCSKHPDSSRLLWNCYLLNSTLVKKTKKKRKKKPHADKKFLAKKAKLLKLDPSQHKTITE